MFFATGIFLDLFYLHVNFAEVDDVVDVGDGLRERSEGLELEGRHGSGKACCLLVRGSGSALVEVAGHVGVAASGGVFHFGSLSLWLRNYLKKFFNELLHSSLIFAIFVRNCTY